MRYRPSMEEVRGLSWSLGGMAMRSSFEIQRLVGVTRGGLTVVDCVSRDMGIKDIQALAIEVYDLNAEGGNPEAPLGSIKVHRKPSLPRGGEGTLFVDDVLDTGITARFIKENWPNSATAVAYTKKSHQQTLEEIDFYGKYVGGIWIDFPWEREAQIREELRIDLPGIIL